jgi:hypothetical protein
MVESIEGNKLIVGKHALSPVRESSGSLTLFNTLELDLLLRWVHIFREFYLWHRRS